MSTLKTITQLSKKPILLLILAFTLAALVSLTAFAAQNTNPLSKVVKTITSSSTSILTSSSSSSSQVLASSLISSTNSFTEQLSSPISTPSQSITSKPDQPLNLLPVEPIKSTQTKETISSILPIPQTVAPASDSVSVQPMPAPIASPISTPPSPTPPPAQNTNQTTASTPINQAQINNPVVLYTTPSSRMAEKMTMEIDLPANTEGQPTPGNGAQTVRTGPRTIVTEAMPVTTPLPRSSCTVCPVDSQNDATPPAGSIRTGGGGCCR
jgi:hypothetical protein